MSTKGSRKGGKKSAGSKSNSRKSDSTPSRAAARSSKARANEPSHSDSESEDNSVVLRQRTSASLAAPLAAPSSSASSSSPVPVAASSPSPAATAPAAPAGAGDGFWKRFWTTWAMFFAFCFMIHLAHPVLTVMVLFVQWAMYREIVKLSYTKLLQDETDIPLFRTQNWYWYFMVLFFSYGKFLKAQFGLPIPQHSFISFALFVVGFVFFVFTLRPGMYKLQFSMFSWTFLTLVIVVLQSTLILFNMYQGLIWFVLPAIIIISNDTWAYVWGKLIGRTALIQLSPKKTWEGFIGAFVSTCILAFFTARIMCNFPLLTCSQTRVTFEDLTCPADPLFVPVPYQLPSFLSFISPTIGIAPMQWHALNLAIFGSLIAPFGGFFASGFKRAFQIKDFGDSIPGHGGVADRMDCQIMMGSFMYFYYWAFVRSPLADIGPVMSAFKSLTPEAQLSFFEGVKQHMSLSGLLK